MEIRSDPHGLDRLFVIAPEFDATFEVSGAAPVQALGSVRGRELYFRSRHSQWEFEVADHAGGFPSDGTVDSDGFYREGPVVNASYLPLTAAVKIIVRCLREYTGVEGVRLPSL